MIGLITAIESEEQAIAKYLSLDYVREIAGMRFQAGTLKNKPVVLVKSGVGKVNAACAAQILIDHFHVDKLLNIGVGGALEKGLYPGDVVLSRDAVQYDVDARVFGHPWGEVPNMDITAFPASPVLLHAAESAADTLGITYKSGRILTADLALGDSTKKEQIVETFAGSICDMEGAAILQTAYINGVDALVIRSVSDSADEEAESLYSENVGYSAERAAELLVQTVKELEDKEYVRPTRALVDLNRLEENFKNIKKRAGEKKICAVVKADAYGHGIGAIRAIDKLKPDYYAVACIEEGIALRRAGITGKIMILGHTFPERAEELIKYQIEPTVYQLDHAEAFSRAAQRAGTVLPVHVKIETGMGRIGIKWDEAIETIKEMNALEGINLQGMFTHFATADAADKTFTEEQVRRFEEVKTGLENRGIEIPIYHVENSAALMDLDLDFDMVRPGIILYGHYPSDEVKFENLKIKPVMRFLSKIIQVKELEPGESVGYGRTFVADKKMKVATFPAGYADGYSRVLSHKGTEVSIDGVRVPVLGNICMDQAVVDVTGLDVSVGDDIELFGDTISAEEYADWLGTISYEVTCLVNKRVPRVYIRDGEVESVYVDIIE